MSDLSETSFFTWSFLLILSFTLLAFFLDLLSIFLSSFFLLFLDLVFGVDLLSEFEEDSFVEFALLLELEDFGSLSLVSVSSEAGDCESSTETSPVITGDDNNKADNIKIVAVKIVSFDRTDAVPRGFNAAFEMPLVKSAPASVFPGCSKTAVIKTTQEMKNTMYKKVSKLPPQSTKYNL